MIHRVGTIRPDLHVEHSVRARAPDALDAEAHICEVLSKTTVVDRKINVVANPIGRKFHEISFWLLAVSP